MNKNVEILIEEVKSKNNRIRKNALDNLLNLTREEIEWVYDIWDIFLEKLNSDNSYQRSIGVFLLSNLAKSDYEHRFVEVVDRYLALMEDEKFITSRQTIQNAWKVAIAYDELREKIVNYLLNMFSKNKFLIINANLIRKDIIMSLFKIKEFYNDAVDIVDIELRVEIYCVDKERKELVKLLHKLSHIR